MADVIAKIFMNDQALKLSDFINDTMKLALLSGTYDECSLYNTESYDDISSNEINPSFGYDTGGMLVTGKNVITTTTEKPIVYDIDNIGFTVSGGTLGPVRYGAIYNVTNSNHLVYIFDFGEDKTVNDGGTFQIKVDDKGLFWAEQDCPN